MKEKRNPTNKRKASGNVSKAGRTNEVFQKRQLKIIKKAAKLFMKKGYDQTSMREIAKATGINIGNLYYFIKSKEEILFLVFDMFHKPEEEMFEKYQIFKIENPLEQLKTVIRELINFGHNYRDEMLLLYRESKVLPKRFLKIILTRESRVISQIEEILRKGVEKKIFDIEDLSFTANMIIYELSLYSLRNWNMKKYTKEEIINLIEKHIIKTVVT